MSRPLLFLSSTLSRIFFLFSLRVLLFLAQRLPTISLSVSLYLPVLYLWSEQVNPELILARPSISSQCARSWGLLQAKYEGRTQQEESILGLCLWCWGTWSLELWFHWNQQLHRARFLHLGSWGLCDVSHWKRVPSTQLLLPLSLLFSHLCRHQLPAALKTQQVWQ